MTAASFLPEKDRQQCGGGILIHVFAAKSQVQRKTSRVTTGHSAAVTKRVKPGARQTQLALSQPPSPVGPPLFSCLGSAARLWFVDTFERTIFGALPRPKWSHNPDIYNPTPAGMFSLARFATSRRPPGALNHILSIPYTFFWPYNIFARCPLSLSMSPALRPSYAGTMWTRR